MILINAHFAIKEEIQRQNGKTLDSSFVDNKMHIALDAPQHTNNRGDARTHQPFGTNGIAGRR